MFSLPMLTTRGGREVFIATAGHKNLSAESLDCILLATAVTNQDGRQGELVTNCLLSVSRSPGRERVANK